MEEEEAAAAADIVKNSFGHDYNYCCMVAVDAAAVDAAAVDAAAVADDDVAAAAVDMLGLGR